MSNRSRIGKIVGKRQWRRTVFRIRDRNIIQASISSNSNDETDGEDSSSEEDNLQNVQAGGDNLIPA